MSEPAIDKFQLYRWAVQDPAAHVVVLEKMAQRVRAGAPGHGAEGAPPPLLFREDFAGGGAEAVAWAAADPARRAIAADLDADSVRWGRRRAARILGDDAKRVEFIEGNVLDIGPPQVPHADIITALNFSPFYFHDRASLGAYFAHARNCLAPRGVLITIAFGGPAAMRPGVTRRRIEPKATVPGDDAPPPFDYLWEQRRYDAATGRFDCRIHFIIPRAGAPAPGDALGSTPDSGGDDITIRDAFICDWRLWSLPEITELMRDAGFADVQIWRHTRDPALAGEAGVFLGQVQHMENIEQWIAYIIGVR